MSNQNFYLSPNNSLFKQKRKDSTKFFEEFNMRYLSEDIETTSPKKNIKSIEKNLNLTPSSHLKYIYQIINTNTVLRTRKNLKENENDNNIPLASLENLGDLTKKFEAPGVCDFDLDLNNKKFCLSNFLLEFSKNENFDFFVDINEKENFENVNLSEYFDTEKKNMVFSNISNGIKNSGNN